MEKRLEILESKTATLEKERVEDKMEINCLKTEVRQLKESSDNYLCIRRRFLKTYIRDTKDANLSDHKVIKKGNVVAQEGDALGDAMVYDKDRRQDESLYRELYGLPHTKLLEYCMDQNRLL